MVKKKENKSKRLAPIVFYASFIILFISLIIWFIQLKNKIVQYNKEKLKKQSILLSNNINHFFEDAIDFLKSLDVDFEKELNISPKLNEKQINNLFKSKYNSTKDNLITNYNYVLTNRINRKEISACYLPKTEIVNKEVKDIAILTEKLDYFWKMFFYRYPFVSLSYVDKTGFYREFPFRKLRPDSVGFLSDPRNFQFYSIALTIGKNEVYLTSPYLHNNRIFISLIIPVYEQNRFRGVLTINIPINGFIEGLNSGLPFLENLKNAIVFNNKGDVFFYQLESGMHKCLINTENLNNFLQNNDKTFSKKIKIYPLLSNKEAIVFVENYLDKKEKNPEVKEIDEYIISLTGLKFYNLNLFCFIEKESIFQYPYFQNIKTLWFWIFLIALFAFFSAIFLISYTKRQLPKNTGLDPESFFKDDSLKRTFLRLKASFKGDETEDAPNYVKSFLNFLNKEVDFFKLILDNIDMGILVLDKKGALVFRNKWFKQFIIDVKKIELMPDSLKSEILKFINDNSLGTKKEIRVFEKLFMLKAEKITLTSLNNHKEPYFLFILSPADELNTLKTDKENLKRKIKTLEDKLFLCQKNTEELNSKIIQSDKFAVFGELIQGIVHNINNPLMIVMSRLSMVKSIIEKMEDNLEKKRLLKHMTNILASLHKINLIINSVLLKAKITAEKEERLVDLNEIIKSELDFFNADLFYKHKVKLKTELDNNLPPVRISQSDFSQIINNLIKNALDELKSVPEPKLKIKTYAKEGKVFVEIIDNGPGVPENLKDKIFEQYFTTKGAQGTGIGLYNARKILEEYHGELTLEKSKRGARFVIKLPSAGEQ